MGTRAVAVGAAAGVTGAASLSGEAGLAGVPRLLEDLARLSEDTDSADIVFLLGREDTPVYAHRIILQARCKNFTTTKRIGSPGNQTPVRMPHAHPETFRQFINYIYTGKIMLQDSGIFEMLGLAQELGVDELWRSCEEHVSSTLSPGNACALLTAALEAQDRVPGGKGACSSFIERCFAFIGENAVDTVKTTSFRTLPKDALVKLISSDYLGLEEEEVWRAVLNWAKYQAGVTQPTQHWTEEERARVCQHLSGVINHVRLLLIDSQVFAEEVEPTGAVPMELSLERYKYAALPNKYAEICSDKRLQPRASPVLFPGSQILSRDKIGFQRLLNQWYGVPKQGWRLIYKASSHGYSGAAFHRHCDGISPTYIIALGTRGEICGGFSDVPWGKTSAKGHYSSSEKAFLFTLTNTEDVPPTKYSIIKKPFAICYHPETGPIFGAGADLLIASNCNTNMESYSNLPHSYDGEHASNSVLMGDYHFSVADYEEQEQNDDDSDEEMEEVEPRLKYVRMRNDLENILQKDAASCIAVHPKFLCLGSHWGRIHLLDHQGNNIRSKMLQAHTVAVNQISIDQNGDFIASCSDDGKVFIYGLYSPKNNHNMSMGRFVKSIALDPNYYKTGSGQKFITGDNKLILYEQTFLSRIKPTVLCEAEGGVRSVSWAGQLVAWASDTGVRIYDLNGKCSLGLITWKGSLEASPEHYRCNLRWSDNKTLLIGWVDTVRICQIRKRSQHEMANRDLPEHVVDLVSTFQVDFYISGIAPLGSQLVLLGCLKEPDENGKSQRPMLHVVEPKYQEYTAICANSLTLRGYKEYSCNDYHLDCLTDENRYFIVSPKDVVVASLYDTDDRIEWLLTHGKFEQALETITAKGGKDCKRHTLIYVGRVYLDHLLASERYDDAGKLCLKILGRDKKLWEEEVYKFARVHQLRSISSYLPRGDVTLSPSIYEMVLYEYLKMDPEGFLQLVKEWSPTLYTVAAVVNGVLEHLLTHDNCQNLLLEALAILYSHDEKYDKALAMYLKLRHPDVFQLIQKHHLYNSIYDMVEGLMDLNAERAIQFFLEKTNGVPSEIVIEKLQNNQRYLYMYLDELDKKDTKDSKGKYHGDLVRLYADYSRDKLLPFLKRSDNYPIQQALDICSKRQFYPEMVYLLRRIGNNSEALALLTRELNDMESAIQFCQEHDDNELWNDLVNYSLDKPEAITFLLQRIGTYLDPRLILQRIEPSLEIPGLKKALVKMMCDYNLQVSVQAGCKQILANDYFNLHEKLVRSQQKGICTDDDQMCCACHRKIIIREPRNLVIFYCRHSFHEDCLPNLELVENCVICNPQKITATERKL